MRPKFRHLALAALMAIGGRASALTLNAAGSTFIYPLASKWFYDYAQKTGIDVNYQSIGSGGGIRQLMSGTVDFGASDGFLSRAQMAQMPTPVFHIPATMGAEAIAYNLPGVPDGMRLDAAAVAGIYLGTITKWNDPHLVRLNPGFKLPDQAITVVHRSDGSGTTAIFTEYLSMVSPQWKTKVGQGTSVNWPVGIGGKGNEGVAGEVNQVAGSVGYLELAYVLQNHMSSALVRNRAGRFVKPSIASTSRAAAGALRHMPADFRVWFTDAAGKASYPICGFSWFLVPQTFKDAAKGKAVVDLLNWVMDQGQTMAPSLDYAPLPASLVTKIKARIAQIRY